MKMRLTLAALVAAVSCFAIASTASAQPHQNGLVNVAVSNNTIQVPIGIAANICDVAVNVLAQGTATGPAHCDAVGNATATG